MASAKALGQKSLALLVDTQGVSVTEIGEQSGSGSQLRSERRGEATGSFGDPDRWMLLDRS